MRIGVLGTGMVGQTLGAKLAELGHDVAMGTRDPRAALARTEPAQPWMTSFADWHAANPSVRVVTFAEAAAHGEIVLNATSGNASLEALGAAGAENLEGKILVDISNPLDFSAGYPPTLSVCNDDSLGESIQRAFPGARVVKSLNTIGAPVMVDPDAVAGGEHHIFVSGDDADAKAEVRRLLGEWFGWRAENVVDLGDISTSRGTEMYLALWIRLMPTMGSPLFNIRLVK